MYCFYGKSNRGYGICPLYRGCPPFGESVIRSLPTEQILFLCAVVMSVRLSPSGVYSVCPGEEVIYRCIIPGVSVLRWIIRPSPIEANVEFVFTSSMTELQMASISGVIFVARVDSTNPSFNSTLTTTASQSFVSDGIMIECTSGGVTNSSTLNINGAH